MNTPEWGDKIYIPILSLQALSTSPMDASELSKRMIYQSH